jgi:hypothetical protein
MTPSTFQLGYLRHFVIVAVVVCSAVLVKAPSAQATSTVSPRSLTAAPCRAVDGVTLKHLHYLRISSVGTTAADSAWRSDTHVPVVADTLHDIGIVADSSLCAAALNAYNALVTPDSAATEIELFQADTVYVAAHPLILSGEFVASHVFDRSFRYLGTYMQ